MDSNTKPQHKPGPRHPWHVERVAVDEPEEGESGTIYEYQVKESHRTVVTVHYKDDADSIARDHNTAPDLLTFVREVAAQSPSEAAHNPEKMLLKAVALIARATEGK